MRVEQRAAYPVAAFAHGGLCHAHHGERRQAVGEMNLDVHDRAVQPVIGARQYLRVIHRSSLSAGEGLAALAIV